MAKLKESRRFKYLDTLFYFGTVYTLYPIFKIYHRAEGISIRNVPREGPFIGVANHASFLDPWYLSTMFRARHFRYFITNKWYSKSKLWRCFFDLYATIPATPENLEPSTVKSVFKILKNGGAVVIFPEGRVSDDGLLQEFKPGAVFLAAKAKVPIIPFAICGTHEILGRGILMPRPAKLKIIAGEPIDVSSFSISKNDLTESCIKETQKIKDWIADQLRQFKNRE